MKKTKQQEYIVRFTTLNKSLVIQASSFEQAELWALQQLSSWGEESDITIERPDAA